jgi:hypothetical protein
VTVVARRTCRDATEAEALRRAVAPDNPEFVHLRVEGQVLVAEVTSPSAASLRATFEDLMACLQAAERTVGATPAAPSRGGRSDPPP